MSYIVQLLVDSLCVLLQWTAVQNFLVSAAARASLLEIAKVIGDCVLSFCT